MIIIPHFVRHNIYQFLDIKTLLDKIQFLSRRERDSIIESGYIKRTLIIDFDKIDSFEIDQISYALKLFKKVKIIVG